MKSLLWDEVPPDAMTPIEDTLYLHLRKICRHGRINFDLEHRIGNYRLDAITESGFGFEADGKEFHKDKARDNRRDKWILENASRYGVKLHTIIRLPGFVLWYHEFAVRSILADVLGVDWPCECDIADDVEDALDDIVNDGDINQIITSQEYYLQSSCFGKCNSCYVVGNSLAFASCSHEYLSHCKFNPSIRKIGVVEIKRLDNISRWNPLCEGFALGWRRRNEA